ncbi:MAG TPA: alpha/beta hydrolase [Opitutaceae bacterium]|nr:alpha/beta hydrolase [Opitutaceae bacterium]
MRHGRFGLLLVSGLVFLAPCGRPQTPPELPAPQATVLFGQKILYYDVGTGPTVVLIHGMGSSAKGDWGRCITALSAHHRVLAPDLLGFGGSDKPFIDYGIQTWVDFLGEFLRERKPGDFALVGESLGGWIVAQYAIQSLGSEPPVGPSFALPKPSRLVLSDAAGHRRLATKPSDGSVSSLAATRALLGSVFHGAAWRTDDALRADYAWSMGKGDSWTIRSFVSNSATQAEAVDGKLGGITIPTLVVWGAYDGLVPLDDGRDYAARIAGARLVVIPECGHAPCIEDPPAFLAALQPFLDGKP